MTLSPATVATVGVTGAWVSRRKDRELLGWPMLPEPSTTRAVTPLGPSAPRSCSVTVKSTVLLWISAAVSVKVLGVPKDVPFRRNSTTSPTWAPPSSDRVTRNTVLPASDALIQASSRSLPTTVTTGAPGGGSRSRVKFSAALCAPTLPAWSVMEAVKLFAPSAPRSEVTSVKLTECAAMSAPVSTTA